MNFDRSLAALAVLAAIAVTGIASRDTGLLLGLAPAVSLLVSLVAGLFPGERTIESAGRWLSELRFDRSGRPRYVSLPSGPSIGRSRLDRLALKSRGPPALLTI